MVTILRPLGVLPIIAQIATSIVTWMVKSRLSAYEAAQQAAAEYEILQRLTEAQISELAVELGGRTEYADWQWFNILRWAQQYGLVRPPPPPIPLPDRIHDSAAETPMWMWGIVAGVAVLALLYTR